MTDFHFWTLLLEHGGRLGSTSHDLTRDERTKRRRGVFLLVGEAPSSAEQEGASRPGEPLTHDGKAGQRLMSLLGCDSKIEYYATFDRANLLPVQPKAERGDSFNEPLAILSAKELLNSIILFRYKLVILLGRRVQKAFGYALEDGTLRTGDMLMLRLPRNEPFVKANVPTPKFIVCPHPSGVSHYWNSPENVRTCQVTLQEAMRQALR